MGTEASLVTIYVTADIQTVNITFVNSDGTALVGQVPNVSINGTSGAEISYADLVVGYLTQAGYYADANGTFTFDFTANGTSTTDSDPQTLTITLYPDYQLAGIISNNQPATDPATGNPYTQIPTSVSEGQYGITGPDGQVYATLAEALASNSIFDTTTNNGLSIDGAPQSFVVNYEVDPVSESTSMSESESTSISESESNSISTSNSESDSSSTSLSVSESESISQSEDSTSESISESISESESISISESESISTSESLSESESVSESISESESVSTSESDSNSTSDSISESESISNSESDSESISTSTSES